MPKFPTNFHNFWSPAQCAVMKWASAGSRKKKKYSGTNLWEEESRDMDGGEMHPKIWLQLLPNASRQLLSLGSKLNQGLTGSNTILSYKNYH